MRLRSPHLWIGILSVTAVLAIVVDDLGRTSPGELSAVHQRVDKLTGFRSCAQCHGGWTSTMTESCIVCHAPIGAQLERGAGLHGRLGKERGGECGTCHSEHHGSEFALVNRQTFAKAGVGDPDQFDHALVGLTLEGRHLELGCRECHRNADLAILPAGQPRFLGLQRDCGTCHKDAHEGRMVLACAQCHGQRAFDQLSSLDHDKVLPLTGGHARASCRDCHARESAFSLEALGHGEVRQRRSCADCHESPHATDFVAGVARLASLPPAAACSVCHQADHDSFRADDLTVTAAQHAASGFDLEAPHSEATCAQCHVGGTFAELYPGRRADDCRQCHTDPHGGQFDGSPLAANGCIDCHDRQHFAPHAFTVAKHANTTLPLTGSHLEADCNDCHQTPANDAPRVFRGTPAKCESCHGDAHDGFFDALVQQPGANPANGKCALCHQPTRFAELPQAGFDHGRWTGFAITGAHAQAACESCHPLRESPDAFGRRFGRVAEHFGAKPGAAGRCAVCHRDPHEGLFDLPGLPQTVDGRSDCARCHAPTSFRAFDAAFDHERWTGFRLDGAHRKTACSSCHVPLREADAAGRTWAHARGRACADCHTDPHGEQFRAAGRNDCSRCHRVAEKFTDLSFNHELHSRFKLGTAHSRLACAVCHKPVREGDVEVIRYRPLGHECADCHGGQQDPLRRRPGGRR